MISIAPTEPGGGTPIVLAELPASSLRYLRSRVTRVATLDGGSVILNSGTSESDRTLTVDALVTAEQADRLEAMQAHNPMSTVSTATGFYYGAVQDLTTDNGVLRLTFLVKTKAG